MSNYTIINGQFHEITDDALCHYGVLGMKWGVRRGQASQAYSKASKKLSRLDRKADKAVEKAYNKQAKADMKASSFFATPKSAMKADFKAKKAMRKASTKANRARKWLHSMDQTFSNTTESLSREQIELGKKYTDIMNRRTF